MDESPELRTAITDARGLAREQVLAAWQLHLDRVREQLDSGWREVVEKIFEERFGEIENRLLEGFEAAVSAQAASLTERTTAYARSSARKDLTEWLNQVARRLKQAETSEVWTHTLLDAAAAFCGKAAFLVVTGTALKLQGIRSDNRFEPSNDTEVPLGSAPAFASAVGSVDTVVAMGSARELSQTIASMVGESPGGRVYLFPIVVHQRAVAVLYAEPDGEFIEVSALELLVAMAASSIEITEKVTITQPGGELVGIRGAEHPPQAQAARSPGRLPSWGELSKPEQEVHLRAQRFARTQVAQLLLHKVNQVRSGRASKDLYGALRGDIDAGRDAFRQQYFETCPSMVDYYHLELVRTLAKDSGESLGPDYPGALVHQ